MTETKFIHSVPEFKTNATLQIFDKPNGEKFKFNENKHPNINMNANFSTYFNTTILLFLIVFFAIYTIFNILLGGFTANNLEQLLQIRGYAFNITVLISFFVGLYYFYFSLENLEQEHFPLYVALLTKNEMNDINTIPMIGIGLFFFYIILLILQIPIFGQYKPYMASLIEAKSLIYLFMMVIVIFFIYILKIEIVDWIFYAIFKIWNLKITTDPVSVPVPVPVPASSPTQNKEVFNVGNNKFTYDDAQYVCQSYGAEIASYDQIEEAYNKGGEWCNYGWSADQMAFFPTQKSTWINMQNDPDKKNNCGRPGVNGGYMENPNLKFGVNCYGVKPVASPVDLEIMKTNAISQNLTPDNIKLQQYMNANKDFILNSFNETKWNEF